MDLPLERGVTALPAGQAARRRRLFSATSATGPVQVKPRGLTRSASASSSLSVRNVQVKPPGLSSIWSQLKGTPSLKHRSPAQPLGMGLQSNSASCWSQVSVVSLGSNLVTQHEWLCRHSQKQSEKQAPPRPRSRSNGQQAHRNGQQAHRSEGALGELLPAAGAPEKQEFRADGLWWQWQQEGPFEWIDFEPEANAQLEEAYAQGQPTCSFWVAGILHVWNLQEMRRQDSLSRIRRVRMPIARLDAVPPVLPENVPDTRDGLGAWAFSQMSKQDESAKHTVSLSRLLDLSDPLFFSDLGELDANSAEDPEAAAVSFEAPMPTKSAWAETSASRGTLPLQQRKQKHQATFAQQSSAWPQPNRSGPALLAPIRPKSVSR